MPNKNVLLMTCHNYLKDSDVNTDLKNLKVLLAALFVPMLFVGFLAGVVTGIGQFFVSIFVCLKMTLKAFKDMWEDLDAN